MDQADFGGAREDRTPDLVIANDALSQLSYGPVAFLILHTGRRGALARGGQQRGQQGFQLLATPAGVGAGPLAAFQQCFQVAA